MNLYEIDAQIANCVKLESGTIVDTSTGEIIDIEALQALEMERDKKIENIGLWVKNLTAYADAVKTEKERLNQRQKAAENNAARLKEYLASVLNGNKFKTPKVQIGWRKSSMVNVTDMDLLPDEFKKTVTTVTPDKLKIKDDLKAGVDVPGAILINYNNISIK